jgi:glutathione S-transferase
VDIKEFGATLIMFKSTLDVFEKHLRLRNFLVGHSMTLADVMLVVRLVLPLQHFLD